MPILENLPSSFNNTEAIKKLGNDLESKRGSVDKNTFFQEIQRELGQFAQDIETNKTKDDLTKNREAFFFTALDDAYKIEAGKIDNQQKISDIYQSLKTYEKDFGLVLPNDKTLSTPESYKQVVYQALKLFQSSCKEFYGICDEVAIGEHALNINLSSALAKFQGICEKYYNIHYKIDFLAGKYTLKAIMDLLKKNKTRIDNTNNNPHETNPDKPNNDKPNDNKVENNTETLNENKKAENIKKLGELENAGISVDDELKRKTLTPTTNNEINDAESGLNKLLLEKKQEDERKAKEQQELNERKEKIKSALENLGITINKLKAYREKYKEKYNKSEDEMKALEETLIADKKKLQEGTLDDKDIRTIIDHRNTVHAELNVFDTDIKKRILEHSIGFGKTLNQSIAKLRTHLGIKEKKEEQLLFANMMVKKIGNTDVYGVYYPQSATGKLKGKGEEFSVNVGKDISSQPMFLYDAKKDSLEDLRWMHGESDGEFNKYMDKFFRSMWKKNSFEHPVSIDNQQYGRKINKSGDSYTIQLAKTDKYGTFLPSDGTDPTLNPQPISVADVYTIFDAYDGIHNRGWKNKRPTDQTVVNNLLTGNTNMIE